MKQSLGQHGNSSSQFLKVFNVAEGKVGKTTYLAAASLGALPHQKKGLVTKPEHLHILGFDEAFADGLLNFLKVQCKVPEAVANAISIWSLTKEARGAGQNEGWDFSLFNAIQRDLQAIKAEVARGGTHAIVISSLTGMATGIKAGIAGPPVAGRKSSGMDQAKWDALNQQMATIRSMAQADTHHIFWEGHIVKKGSDDDKKEEAAGIQGSVGKNWAFNVEHVFRMRREAAKYEGTKVDKVFMETAPSLDFVSGGRGVTGVLEAREYDIVAVAEKLGKKVGGFVVERGA